MTFSTSMAIDMDFFASQFSESGYASIPGILPQEQAERIHRALSEFTDWNLVCNDRGRHIDLAARQVELMSTEQRRQLTDAIHAQARHDFQYFYNNYPIFDAHREGRNIEHTLHRFYEWLDGDAFLDFARTVTGFDDIAFVDAQATRYASGHFLTTHDDSQADKCRRAAYIFNFTPDWSADWGGFLQLLDDNNHIRRGLRPTFNTLNLIAVPQPHNVSIVAPFAAGSRLSITGWLRYGEREQAPPADAV
jgi:Rps23 Pro-64 3,4-dihydroxylase Tpa1-like proline 4-hydroxylase